MFDEAGENTEIIGGGDQSDVRPLGVWSSAASPSSYSPPTSWSLAWRWCPTVTIVRDDVDNMNQLVRQVDNLNTWKFPRQVK